MTPPPGPRQERLLSAALLALVLALAALEARSDTAARLRQGRPVAAILELGRPGDAPAETGSYLLSYLPRDRRLEAVLLTPASAYGDGLGLPEPSWRLAWMMPPGGPSPRELSAWVRSWPRDLRFWLHLPSALRTVTPRSRPRLSLYDALRLAFEAYRLEPDAVRSSWLPSPEDLPFLLPRLLGAAASPPPDGPVTVEVLNASGAPGVALQATKVLRWGGLDVVDFRNAPQPEEQTRFWDRSGDWESARRAADALGCEGTDILTRLEIRRGVRVTAVLGRDYARCVKLRSP